MSLSATGLYKGYDRAFCVRMKSTLTKRGCHFKSSGYRVSEIVPGLNEFSVSAHLLISIGVTYRARRSCKIILYIYIFFFTRAHTQVVLLLCRLRPQFVFSHARKSAPPLMGMVGLAIALPPPSVHEIRLETDMFVTRISFDFRIAHCEPK